MLILRFFGTRLKRLLHMRILPTPTVGKVAASFSILGVLVLGYLCGAAAMFYQWPSADFLDKCFAGARAWLDRGRPTLPLPSGVAEKQWEGISIDLYKKTCDGFTLYTMSDGSRASLIDMRGNLVHRWQLPFRQAWSQAPHISHPLMEQRIYWACARLYPNGDLLAIYHADGDTPYGYGLVKLDKDSKLLWVYDDNVHHDVEVGEDGTIYTLTHDILTQLPAGMKRYISAPLLADSLVVLSPEGRELERIPLLEAFRDSPYALMLGSVTKQSVTQDDKPGSAVSPPGPAASNDPAKPDDPAKKLPWRKDLLHANSVRVLPRALASKFPLFKPGQVLISLRNLDTLMVVDRHSRSIVWACSGVWRAQHDAEFLENGRLLVYDNLGSLRQGTRILEYDPLTQAIPWFYANEHSTPFRAMMRGAKQRLPNGNTLIVDPDHKRLFEVTPDKEVVWECYCPSFTAPQDGLPHTGAVTSARRYHAEELTFLKGVAHARP
jgi:hypothetical protein